MRKILVMVLLATLAPTIQAQQHQARDWHCFRQHFVETTDGDVLVPQCVAALRSQGLGCKKIAAELGIGVGTLYRLSLDGSKIRERVI